MATIQNLNSTHISEEINTQVNEQLTALETTIAPLMVNLLPDERRRYGSVGEQNKLLINKTRDYATDQPSLRSPDVDWDEFAKDYADRALIEGYASRLQRVVDGLNNAKTLHDFDNYQAALDDYAYTGYKARTATPGFEPKHSDLKQFFTRSKPAVTPENPTEGAK